MAWQAGGGLPVRAFLARADAPMLLPRDSPPPGAHARVRPKHPSRREPSASPLLRHCELASLFDVDDQWVSHTQRD